MNWTIGLIWVLFLVLTAEIGIAQNNIRNRIFIGGNGAPQIALILNQNNYGYSELAYRPKIGFQIGPKIGYEWNNYNQIEIGANWTTLGQSYEDNIQNVVNEKVVELDYVYFPVLYKRIFGYIDQWSDNTGTGNFYAAIGFQPGFILDANISWEKDNIDIEMFQYIMEDGNNPNQSDLLSLGPPANAKELFKEVDFMGLLSLGYQYWISTFTSISLELKNGIGFTDINADAWKLPNRKGIYEPSRNAFTALNLSVQVFF